MQLLKKPLVLTLSLFILVLSACVDKPQETLRIGAVLWPGYEPLYVANKLGYFADKPVKIIDYLSNTDAMLAFKNHNLEAGAFTLDETLQLISDEIDVEVILIMDISNGGDVILANPEIKNVKDLHGKPVAVESSAVGAFVLKRALELNDMELSDIKIISTNAMEQVSSFKKGQVVASVTFDPYRTSLLKLGKKEIFNSTLLPNEIIDVLVVRKEYADEYPDVIQQVVDGWYRALEYQGKHPVESAAYSLNRFNTTSEEYIAGLKLIKFASRAENRQLLDAKTSPLLKQQQDVVQILNQLGRLENNKQPSLEGHLNKSFNK